MAILTPIEDCEPATCQEFGVSVTRILSEAGLRAERGKVLATVRGGVEVDVYAEDHLATPLIMTVIE